MQYSLHTPHYLVFKVSVQGTPHHYGGLVGLTGNNGLLWESMVYDRQDANMGEECQYSSIVFSVLCALLSEEFHVHFKFALYVERLAVQPAKKQTIVKF